MLNFGFLSKGGGIPVRPKLLLILRPLVVGGDEYKIPESHQAELFAIFGSGLWFDSGGVAAVVDSATIAASLEINQWAVWYHIGEVLFYNPDTLLYSEYIKISNYFNNTSGLYDAILYYDADEDPGVELTGGPSTFNSSILGPQYQRLADGSYINVGAQPAVDTFDGEKWLRSCGAVTNLLDTDDLTAWTPIGASISATTAMTPCGRTAYTIVCSASDALHYVFKYFIVSSGPAHARCHLKAGVGRYAALVIRSGDVQWRAVVVDFESGTADTVAGAGAAGGTVEITPLEDGWYDVFVSFGAATETTSIMVQPLGDAVGTFGAYGRYTWLASGIESVLCGALFLAPTSYPIPYTPPGTTMPASNATATNGVWFTLNDGSPVWKALTGEPLTLATRVRMGVRSADLVGDPRNYNILSWRGDTSDYAFRSDPQESNVSIIRVFDSGSSSISRIASVWARNSVVRTALQVNTAGTQFRVGYMIEGTHTAIQWNPWANYDGSFNPSTLYKLMLGYDNPYPMWFNKITAWKKQATDAEILEAMA